MSDEYHKKIREFHGEMYKGLISCKYNVNYRYSTARRLVGPLQKLKTNYNLPKVSTIVVSFRVANSSIYAYLYSTFTDKIEHKCVCIGGTLRSHDGEYRYKIIPWSQFEKLFEVFADHIDIVDEFVTNRFDNDDISFDASIYFPNSLSDQHREEYEKNILGGRTAIKLYELCWMYDFGKIMDHTIHNHTLPQYISIIYGDNVVNNNTIANITDANTDTTDANTDTTDTADAINVFNNFVKSFKSPTYPEFVQYISNLHNNFTEAFSFENLNARTDPYTIRPIMGQKLLTLNRYEIERYGDITFATWRELHFMHAAADLVMNFISPSFPFIVNWIIIQNSSSQLFDNVSIQTKYDLSDVSKDITDGLISADDHNFVNDTRGAKFRNGRFRKLSEKIAKAIRFNESYLVLTSLTLCIMQEHVGRTLKDIPIYIQHEPNLREDYVTVFEDEDLFMKNIFEFIYSLYCLNTKLGIFHNDLHLNNATMYQFINFYNKQTKKYLSDSPVIVYKMEDYYVFPYIGLTSIIIDFSRCVISDVESLERDYGRAYANKFLKYQKLNIMNSIEGHFPKLYSSNKEGITTLIESNFETAFRILSAVDTLAILKGLLFICQELKNPPSTAIRKINIPTSIISTMEKMLKRTEDLTKEYFSTVLKDPSKPHKVEFPNAIIIDEFFSKYKKTEVELKDLNICDYFDINAEIKYHSKEYAEYSPLIKIEPMIEHAKKHNVKLRDEFEFIADYLKSQHIIEDDAQKILNEQKLGVELTASELDWMFD